VQFKLGEENNDDETNVQERMKGMTPWKVYLEEYGQIMWGNWITIKDSIY
jgi:hypothetical protein